MPARFVEFGDRQMLIRYEKLPVRRDDIDVAGLKANAPRNLSHRHPRPRSENVGKLALVRRIEMHDDNESSVDIVRQAFKK